MIDLVQDIAPGGRSISSRWSNIIGLEPLDRSNRLVSALAGKFRAQELAAKYVGKQTALRTRQLEQLGLGPQQVLAQGGKLTDDQLKTAALNAANDTQFASTVLDLPSMRNTPQGQFIYLFKSFSMQQGRFVKDLAKEAIRGGNPGPLLRYAATLATYGALAGEAVADVRSVIRHKDRPDDLRERYLEDITFAGGVGMFSDVLNSMSRGREAFASFIMGPAFGEFTQTLPEAWQAVAGDPEGLMRHGISRNPSAVPALAQ
jgi:hypothetical protein